MKGGGLAMFSLVIPGGPRVMVNPPLYLIIYFLFFSCRLQNCTYILTVGQFDLWHKSFSPLDGYSIVVLLLIINILKLAFRIGYYAESCFSLSPTTCTSCQSVSAESYSALCVRHSLCLLQHLGVSAFSAKMIISC